MRVYTVHSCDPAGDDGSRDASVVFVKEGFSWPGFFFTTVWALFCKLWWVAAGLVAVEILIGTLATTAWLPTGFEVVLTFVLALLVGWFGNDLKRWTLLRRGYRPVGIVAAANEDAAALRFFSREDEAATTVRSGA
jgi:hypothetical protein